MTWVMIPGSPHPKNYEAQLTTNPMFEDEIALKKKHKTKNYN